MLPTALQGGQGEEKRRRDQNLRVPWSGVSRLLQVGSRGRAGVGEVLWKEQNQHPALPREQPDLAPLAPPCRAGVRWGAGVGRHASLPGPPGSHGARRALGGEGGWQAGAGRNERHVWGAALSPLHAELSGLPML